MPSDCTGYLVAHNGSCERSVCGPSIADALVKRFGWYANFSSPIDDTKPSTIVLKDNVPAVIPGLLLSGRPLAILWGVIAIVVFAVNLQPWLMTLAHVGNEVGGAFPAFANLDAATAVAFISLVFGVGAATYHRFPNLEERVAPLPMRCYSFLVKASAALRGSIAQAVDEDIARRTSARALNMAEFRVGAFFSEDPENGVAPVNVAGCNNFRRCFYHASPLVG